MISINNDHLETLARGGHVPGEVFNAILKDPAALRELARLTEVHRLIHPGDDFTPTEIPDTDVTAEEVVAVLDNQPLAPERHEATMAFLREHCPELLAVPSADTDIVLQTDTATSLDFSGPADDPAAGRGGKET
jgi:hypothetical protein